MSVASIISEIMEDEQFEEKKTDDEHHRGDEDVLADVDIIDSMEETRSEYAKPEALNTLHLSISFPAKGFLT